VHSCSINHQPAHILIADDICCNQALSFCCRTVDEPLWTREQVEAAFAARFAPLNRATSTASSHLARTPRSGLRTEPGRRTAAQSPKRHCAVRAETSARRPSPQRSMQQSSDAALHQQPALRQAPAPSSPAQTSSAADSSGEEECDGGSSPPADRGPPQHQAVQTAPPAARVFVCEDLKGEYGPSHSTAEAATQAEVEDVQVFRSSKRGLAASEAAHNIQGAASAGAGNNGQDDGLSIALPSKDKVDGDDPSTLASLSLAGRHGQDAPREPGDHTEPAHEETAGPDAQRTLASDVETDISIDAGLDAGIDGEGDDGDGAADGDSYVAPGATVAGAIIDAALTPGEQQSAFAVAADGAGIDDPLAPAGSGERPAADVQLHWEPDAEARQEPHSLSEQALHDSEAQLQELAALATELQQVSLKHSDITSVPASSECRGDIKRMARATWPGAKPVSVLCVQAVELGDGAQLQGTAPMAAASDSLLSTVSQPGNNQRNSLEDATLECARQETLPQTLNRETLSPVFVENHCGVLRQGALRPVRCPASGARARLATQCRCALKGPRPTSRLHMHPARP